MELLEDYVVKSDPESRSALRERADSLRAQYGREGKTVYDRLDRWLVEHADCTDHESSVERCVYVIHCRMRDAVAVCESWQFSGESR